MKQKNMPFYQNNVSSDRLRKNMSKIHRLQFELFPKSPYWPDLTPSDFSPFAELKK